MLTALLVLFVIGVVFWLGIKILGIALSAIFFLCIKLPLMIIFGGLGIIFSLFAAIVIGKVVIGLLKSVLGGA